MKIPRMEFDPDERLRIYLAGKISGTNWRYEIAPDLERFTRNLGDIAESEDRCDSQFFHWPTLERVVLGRHDYTGPYFTHRLNTAEDEDRDGWGPKHRGPCDLGNHGEPVDGDTLASLCFDAIRASDLVFGWLTEPGLYGTAAEIGFALGIGVSVAVVDLLDIRPDWWFLRAAADFRPIFHEHSRPQSMPPSAWALHTFLSDVGWLAESPIEFAFHMAARGRLWGLVAQYPVGRYRIDFALPRLKLAVELDGHDYHKTKEQRTHDAKRDRALGADGWSVLRFTGSEVFRDPAQCVSEVSEEIRRRDLLALEARTTRRQSSGAALTLAYASAEDGPEAL